LATELCFQKDAALFLVYRDFGREEEPNEFIFKKQYPMHGAYRAYTVFRDRDDCGGEG
jgi:hypothetical protein